MEDNNGGAMTDVALTSLVDLVINTGKYNITL